MTLIPVLISISVIIETQSRSSDFSSSARRSYLELARGTLANKEEMREEEDECTVVLLSVIFIAVHNGPAATYASDKRR